MCENMCAPSGNAYVRQAGRAINISVRTIVDRNASAAEVTYVVSDDEGGTVYRQTGSSKREPGDPFYADLGEQLAVSRALEKMAAELRDVVFESFPWNPVPEPLVTLDDVMVQAAVPEESYLAWMFRWIKSYFGR
jgi:uncharacterized protein DUF1876